MIKKVLESNKASWRSIKQQLINRKEALLVPRNRPFAAYHCFSFKDPIDLYPWELETDFTLGGSTQAVLEYVDGRAVFKGHLMSNRETSYSGDLFARAKIYRGYRFSHINGVQFRVKTDGNPWELGLYMQAFTADDMHWARIVDATGDWVTMELPIVNFRLQRGMNTLEVTPMQKLIGLAFELRSKTETKFQIELGSMEFIWRDELEYVSTRYYDELFYH